MHTPSHLLPTIACAAGLSLGACQAQAPSDRPATQAVPHQAVPHQIVQASATCGTEDSSVQRIATSVRLKQILPDAPPPGSAVAPKPDPQADTAQALVLRVSMGQQPSAGAQFAVTAVRLDAAARRLVVDTLWNPPDPKQMHAMVITRPCVMLSVPRGDYEIVQVLDQQGRLRASATLSGPASR